MDKIVEKTLLYDFYGELLTDHRREIYEEVVFNDMSLSEAAEEYGVPFLDIDFKKKAGFQRSIQLSKEYELYRQDYCGCPFSKRDKE